MYIGLVLGCIDAEEVNWYFSAFFEIYKMCIFLHRSNLRYVAKPRQKIDDSQSHRADFAKPGSSHQIRRFRHDFDENFSVFEINISRTFDKFRINYQAVSFRQFSFIHRQDSLHRR